MNHNYGNRLTRSETKWCLFTSLIFTAGFAFLFSISVKEIIDLDDNDEDLKVFIGYFATGFGLVSLVLMASSIYLARHLRRTNQLAAAMRISDFASSLLNLEANPQNSEEEEKHSKEEEKDEDSSMQNN